MKKHPRFALFLSLLLLSLPVSALGEDGVRLYDLTATYGLEHIDDYFFLDENRLFITQHDKTWEEDDKDYTYSVYLLSLDQEEPVFHYTTRRELEDYDEMPTASLLGGDTLHIIFSNNYPPFEDEKKNHADELVDTLTIGVDGEPHWHTVSAATSDPAVTMPGGAQIIEENGCLYLKETADSAPKHLLGDVEDNLIFTGYSQQRWHSVFQAVDAHRFV